MNTQLNDLRLKKLLATASVVEARRIQRKLNSKLSKLVKKDFGNEVQKKDDLLLSNGFFLLEANRQLTAARRRARAMHLYQSFYQGRPYCEVEAKLKSHTPHPHKVLVNYLPDRLDYDSLLALLDWIEAPVKPSDARLAKVLKAEEKSAAMIAARKAASAVAHAAYLNIKENN